MRRHSQGHSAECLLAHSGGITCLSGVVHGVLHKGFRHFSSRVFKFSFSYLVYHLSPVVPGSSLS